MDLALQIAGFTLMLMPRLVLVIDPAVGDALREAFGRVAGEPVPEDMRALTQSIAGPLRIVSRKEQS